MGSTPIHTSSGREVYPLANHRRMWSLVSVAKCPPPLAAHTTAALGRICGEAKTE